MFDDERKAMPSITIRRWGIPVATVIGDGVSCTVNNLGRFSLWLRPKKRASAKYLNRQIELLPGETYVWPGNAVYVVVKRR
jgi:hypothetical protein